MTFAKTRAGQDWKRLPCGWWERIEGNHALLVKDWTHGWMFLILNKGWACRSGHGDKPGTRAAMIACWKAFCEMQGVQNE